MLRDSGLSLCNNPVWLYLSSSFFCVKTFPSPRDAVHFLLMLNIKIPLQPRPGCWQGCGVDKARRTVYLSFFLVKDADQEARCVSLLVWHVQTGRDQWYHTVQSLERFYDLLEVVRLHVVHVGQQVRNLRVRFSFLGCAFRIVKQLTSPLLSLVCLGTL